MLSMQFWSLRQPCMLPNPICTRTCIDLGPLTIDITSQHYHSQHQLESVHTCDQSHVTTTIFAFLYFEYLCAGWDMMGGWVRVCDKWETTSHITAMR